MTVSDVLADRISEICKEKNITMKELCQKSGVSYSTVNSIIKHKHGEIRLMTIIKLCKGMEINIPDFFHAPEFQDLKQILNKK